MITRIWSGTSRLYFLLLPFSLIYGLITSIIRFSYRRGWFKVHRFPLPIVVIGNLTVGGNGKTPLVLWLVTQLQHHGFRVGVVSRGYGGRAVNYPLLLDEKTTSDQSGDEPLLIWQRLGSPVAVAPQRAKAVAALLHAHNLDIVVSDDGLQHYALGRDIEWVVIDGEYRFGNGWWLPAGPMRERISRLKTVQAVIINGGETQSNSEISMHLSAGTAINLLSGERRSLVNLTPIVAIAGIGHPLRFFVTIRKSGAEPIREVAFNDHQIYQKQMFDKLVSSEEQLLMTEKDAVKCRNFARANWWYLPVNAQLSHYAKEKLLTPILQIIRKFQLLSDKKANIQN
ncbi:Tetraacyldisaccharide 4'-kinase [Candidatus Gullanella endobia]|uniref:Tetraacyldisaccharide 4'-kinase n=1 Tax=Candidatus Gullanella endobia TaxID=1070130 RepID=A0A143WRN8_9ENTR|nr:tetraacyldisaccharide 4'-kinase [Candidatus Gullanella endobia]CUX96271.1 Tetraacyldisaccharide 4'-kinase [Candidatus Gullanella endobia]